MKIFYEVEINQATREKEYGRSSARQGAFERRQLPGQQGGFPLAGGGVRVRTLVRAARRRGQPRAFRNGFRPFGRSEEHTSELQSLMRISYAVFRLKKKSYRTRIASTY